MTEEGKPTRGSDDARQWARNLAGNFGEAVSFYRNRLGLSAVQLSARTREIGYPITRGAIAKIEGNHRNGKMDVAEVLVLAAALEVAPIDLVFPHYPSFGTSATPKFLVNAAEAGAWFSASRDYQPFGRANSPRVDLSQELRDKTRRVFEGIERAESKIQFDYAGVPNPESISKEEAEAILHDLLVAKHEIAAMGGSFGGTNWDYHLREMVEDPETKWRETDGEG